MAGAEVDAPHATKPGLLDGYRNLAQLAKEGQLAKAEKELEAEALRLASIDPAAATAALVKLGSRSTGQKGLMAAMREPLLAGLQQAAELHPTPERLAELGRELFRQGRFADAERALGQWTELQKDLGPQTTEMLCWRAAAAELGGGSRDELVGRAVAALQQLAAAKAAAEQQRLAAQQHEAAQRRAAPRPATPQGAGSFLHGAGTFGGMLQEQQSAAAEAARAQAERLRQQEHREREALYEQERRRREIESFYERRIRQAGGR